MSNRFLIGNYFNKDSIIHNINPIFKLIVTLIFCISIFFIKNIYDVLILFSLCSLTIILSKVPLKTFIKTLSSIKVILIFLIILYLLNNKDFNYIFIVCMQIYMVVLYTMNFTMTTRPNDITYSLNVLLSPLKIFKLPINKISFSISLALRFIPTILTQGDKIMKSQASRGVDFYGGNIKTKIISIKSLLLPMFMLTMRKADLLAEVMTIRLYDINSSKYKYHKNKFYYFDYIYLCLNIIIIGIVLI